MSLPELDMRHLCAPNRDASTTIEVFEDFTWVPWIRLGAFDLSSNPGAPRWWTLQAKIHAAVDWDHDNAIFLRLPLLAVEFDCLFNGTIWLNAIIRPSADDSSFRVPPPSYDPRVDGERCKQCAGAPHVFVPYLPPFDAEVFEAMRGASIRIVACPQRGEA